MKYYSLKYTDDLPEWAGGVAKFWFIKIRPKYQSDKGILEHEKTHVRQFWKLLLLHGVLYRFSRWYRQRCEIEAYGEQLQYPPANKNKDVYMLNYYAPALMTKYNLKLTRQQAYKLLKEQDNARRNSGKIY